MSIFYPLLIVTSFLACDSPGQTDTACEGESPTLGYWCNNAERMSFGAEGTACDSLGSVEDFLDVSDTGRAVVRVGEYVRRHERIADVDSFTRYLWSVAGGEGVAVYEELDVSSDVCGVEEVFHVYTRVGVDFDEMLMESAPDCEYTDVLGAVAQCDDYPF